MATIETVLNAERSGVLGPPSVTGSANAGGQTTVSTKWPSVASVLDNLIGAIANGSDFDGWTAEVVDGELTWSLR